MGLFTAKLDFNFINMAKDPKYLISFGPWTEKYLQFSLVCQINNVGHFLLKPQIKA